MSYTEKNIEITLNKTVGRLKTLLWNFMTFAIDPSVGTSKLSDLEPSSSHTTILLSYCNQLCKSMIL